MRRTIAVVGGDSGGSALAKALDSEALDSEADVILASGQRVEADDLVLATGSSYAYPAKPNSPEGPAVIPAATVAEYKGADLFTGRFTEQFGSPQAN
jgi:NADPH-dependent 2,4-dienoyl-CoA reductase/sulfur reductase-like enzyme